MDQRSMDIRGKMEILSRVIKPVTRTPFFNALWKIKTLKGKGPYHKCFSFNYNKDVPFSFSTFHLAPKEEILVELDTFSFESFTALIKLKPLGSRSGINLFREPFVALRGFIYDEHKPIENKFFDVCEIPVQVQQTNLDNPLTFQVEISTRLEGGYKVLMLLSTLSSVEQPVRHSNTIFYSKE